MGIIVKSIYRCDFCGSESQDAGRGFALGLNDNGICRSCVERLTSHWAEVDAAKAVATQQIKADGQESGGAGNGK